MQREEWESLLGSLERTRDEVVKLFPEGPSPVAARCEHSRHRTLAHLRACQEQWLEVVAQFLNRDNPSVKILHPWRKFAQEGYDGVPWGEHMQKFLKDRAAWLELRSLPEWNRVGKMNGKPETVASLTRRLALHEEQHLAYFR